MKHNRSEFELIKFLLDSPHHRVPKDVVGPGDDCAVIPLQNTYLLLTTDTLVEKVHFRFDFSSPKDVGWKAASVTISDIAAMGGEPRYLLVSPTVPPHFEHEKLKEIYEGIFEACKAFDCAVVGGDTVKADTFSLVTTGVGFADKAPIKRSTALLGDDVWVSGCIGEACLGLKILLGEVSCDEDKGESALKKHRRPVPRVALGKALLNNGLATSMIDVSDGLLADVMHIAEESGVEVELEAQRVPCAVAPMVSLKELLTGGDDYELLFTARPEAEEKIMNLELSAESVKLTKIGKVVSDDKSDVIIVYSGGREKIKDFLSGLPSGFMHF